MQHHRALWAAVVLQARDDIDGEHYRSTEYTDAVAFFTAAGPWGESRQAVADCLGLHTDDLTRLGRAAIEARHLRDGPPPVIVRPAVVVATQPTTAPRPEPRVTNPAPVVTRAEVIRRPEPPAKRPYRRKHDDPPRNRDWWIQRFMDKHAA